MFAGSGFRVYAGCTIARALASPASLYRAQRRMFAGARRASWRQPRMTVPLPLPPCSCSTCRACTPQHEPQLGAGQDRDGRGAGDLSRVTCAGTRRRWCGFAWRPPWGPPAHLQALRHHTKAHGMCACVTMLRRSCEWDLFVASPPFSP